MNSKGFTLIETLVAGILLSAIGTALSVVLIQGIKADVIIKQNNLLHDPIKLTWMKISKDLRNAQDLNDYKFIGKKNSVSVAMHTLDSDKSPQLLWVKYFMQDDTLIRTQTELPERFITKNPKKRVILNNIEDMSFSFAYLDAEQRLIFYPFWLEEPYHGIPKAVKVTIKFKSNDQVFTKLISIPQGRWAQFQSEGTLNQ